MNGRYSGCLKRPEGSFRCPGAGVTDGCESPCGCWSFSSGPLELLLTSESFLSPELHFSKTILLILEEFNAIFYGQNFNFISFLFGSKQSKFGDIIQAAGKFFPSLKICTRYNLVTIIYRCVFNLETGKMLFLILKINLFVFYTHRCFARMYALCTMCVQCPHKPDKGVQFPGTGVTSSMQVLEPKSRFSGPLRDQQAC